LGVNKSESYDYVVYTFQLVTTHLIYKIVLTNRRDMSDIVPNWEDIIHKNARTSDGGDAGNVIEIEEDTLTLERGPTAEYVIPKSKVGGFDGSEVSLTISLKELNDQYRKK
jgi:hypothetical protein